MKLKQDFLVGSIFVVGMVLIGIFTIIVKDFSLLSGKQGGTMSIVFDRVDGLEVGHKVLASGMEVGTVSDMELQPDGRVKVEINLTKALQLYDGYSIKVKDASALGGKYVDIEVRRKKDDRALFRLSPEHEETLQAKTVSPQLRQEFIDNGANISEEVNVTLASTSGEWLLEDKKEDRKYKIKAGEQVLSVFSATEEKLEPVVQFPITLASQTESLPTFEGEAKPSIFDNPDIGDLVSSLKRIAQDIEQAEGTVGLLIKEREIYDNILAASDNLKEVTEQLRNPDSTIGKLLYDDKLYGKIDSIVSNVDDITSKVRNGQGLVGRLVNDEELANEFESTIKNADAMMANIRELTERVKNGEGTVGKLFTDDRVYESLDQTLIDARTMIQGINQAVGNINEGKGTLGALVTDEEMANNLRSTLESLSLVAGRLEKGEGTIGKLMKDDELYQEIHRLIKSFSDSIEDTREQVPITTFTGILFKAF